MMKKCFKCKVVKGLSSFYKHKAMKDGHLNKCKECTKSDARENRATHLDSIREYDRKRGGTAQRIKKNTERTRLYRKKFPYKYRAHYAVQKAISSGDLVRPDTCEICKTKGRQIEAHHDDYSQPLLVVWLCSACHSILHAQLKLDVKSFLSCEW